MIEICSYKEPLACFFWKMKQNFEQFSDKYKVYIFSHSNMHVFDVGILIQLPIHFIHMIMIN